MQYTPQRLEKVHRAMEREEIETLLITRTQDVYYLTGYQAPKNYLPTACLVHQGQVPLLLISDLQREALRQDSIMGEVRSFNPDTNDTWYPSHSRSFWNHIAETMKLTGTDSGMIGFQQESLSVRDFEEMKSVLPNAGFKDFSSVIWRLRQVKDAAELDMITQAVKIAEIGVRTALEIVSTEKSESDVSIEIESAMRSVGGQLRGIRAAVLSGAGARFPFSQPGPNRIRSDEIVVIDITVSYNGYFAEIARAVHLGNPTKSQRTLYQDSLNLCQSLEAKISAGITLDDLIKQVSSQMRKGFSNERVVYPLGSSIGLDLREPPHIIPGSANSLRAGMVLSIHPTCYEKGVGSTKVADILHVTDDGCENLTSLARDTM
ncbi:MAG: M24 family metallopeptidase [Candidatus Thorarchaeota archaeon]